MITAEHLRELLDPSPGDTLVVVEGRAVVIPAAEVGADAYRGAVEVVTADEVARHLGDRSPSDQELATLAHTLDTTVGELGA